MPSYCLEILQRCSLVPMRFRICIRTGRQRGRLCRMGLRLQRRCSRCLLSQVDNTRLRRGSGLSLGFRCLFVGCLLGMWLQLSGFLRVSSRLLFRILCGWCLRLSNQLGLIRLLCGLGLPRVSICSHVFAKTGTMVKASRAMVIVRRVIFLVFILPQSSFSWSVY